SYAYRPRPGQDGSAGPALIEVSFGIEPATSVAVVGATGSGKSTLAKLLTRLADPTEGAIRVAGIDLRDVAPQSLRATMVMVPQEAFLFDTTILENVRFGRLDATDEDVRPAFVELGLDGWVDGLADGIDTGVGERGQHLSAGERQLVALARAYVANPSCLVLDEATSSVDPATEARLARALESLSHGRTSITIAHRLATAAPPASGLGVDGGRRGGRGGGGAGVRGRTAGGAGPPRRPRAPRRRVRRAARQLARRHRRRGRDGIGGHRRIASAPVRVLVAGLVGVALVSACSSSTSGT